MASIVVEQKPCHCVDSAFRNISHNPNPKSKKICSLIEFKVIASTGIWSPRVRRDGSPLPSPRYISLSLNPDVNNPDLRYSLLLMQFGQFIDHDLSHVPIFRLHDLNGVDCCRGSKENADYTHPACFSIPIPPNDKLLHGESCMNFVRSMVAPRIDCTFGHADQV